MHEVELKKQLSILILTSLLVFNSSFAFAQSCSSDGADPCPPKDTKKDALPTNQKNVQVTVVDGGDISSTIQNAITDVNEHSSSNGSGVTFSQTGDPNGPQVTIVIDTTSTSPPASTGCGSSDVGCSAATSYDANGRIASAVIYIFAGSTACLGGACFDANAPNYAGALQDVISHEIYHVIGAGDTSGTAGKANPNTGIKTNAGMLLMGKYNGFSVNNSGYQRGISPCDDANVRANENTRATGGPTCG